MVWIPVFLSKPLLGHMERAGTLREYRQVFGELRNLATRIPFQLISLAQTGQYPGVGTEVTTHTLYGTSIKVSQHRNCVSRQAGPMSH